MTSPTADPISDMLPRLRARARKLCRTHDEAEDLTQETALRLWQALHRDGDITAPDRYAMITLHNLARSRWRSRHETEELADDMAQTAPAAPARLACAELRAAIMRLPADQAHLMALVLAGESSPQVLAARHGVPVGTVMSRLARARAKLRVDMGLEGKASVVELL
ncbi:RNA polymerase sigma factor [Sulfitobacter sp. SK011]|uniref:RNA polymerase sigma factor n=1 Tax=Sulfitobacter sp. SK011 TaxID=1389004 RepID=UPI0013B35E22|nr:RNA polymerase sigma factor [Sulfitobacter sp. SK011]